VLKKTHGERRNNAVFKHGTFPDINIVRHIGETGLFSKNHYKFGVARVAG
jgi:hypothetical protein